MHNVNYKIETRINPSPNNLKSRKDVLKLLLCIKVVVRWLENSVYRVFHGRTIHTLFRGQYVSAHKSMTSIYRVT